MIRTLPPQAPTTLSAAFAHINQVTAPSVEDLKIMVLLEAAGLELYRTLAAGTNNPAVAALLENNGREEMAHAHRVAKAILAISGEAYPPPELRDNPYLTEALPQMPVSAERLTGLAHGEFAGETLYETWAANTRNEEAARQFRQNGKEETEHAKRLLEAAALLAA
ncbi:MAG: hypothetical protein RLZZ136_931 [Pseudomonadota bacterium]|jgi:rubrerythrin